MPDPSDKDPGIAVMIDDKGPALDVLNCNCSISRKTTCAHIKKLTAVYRFKQSMLGDNTLEQDFRESIWHRIAAAVSEGSGDTPQTVRSKSVSENGQKVLKIYGSPDEELLTYVSAGADRSRFEDRCIVTRKEDNIPSRAEILAELMLWTLTENEREMSERGFKTRRQALQEKFCYRLAYHAYQELGLRNFTLNTKIDVDQGTFFLTTQDSKGNPVFKLVVPRPKVKALLTSLKANGGEKVSHFKAVGERLIVGA